MDKETKIVAWVVSYDIHTYKFIKQQKSDNVKHGIGSICSALLYQYLSKQITNLVLPINIWNA